MGRVANVYDQVLSSKMPQAAKGCAKVLVKDDSGALAVSIFDSKSLLGFFLFLFGLSGVEAEGGLLLGETVVRQGGLWTSTWAVGLDLDAACIECGGGESSGKGCGTCYVHFPGEG